MSFSTRQDAGPRPEAHMGNAIGALVVSILCGWLIGLIPAIVAIVKAAGVRGRWDAGDHEGARRQAESGVTWATASYMLSFVGLVTVVILRLFVLS